MATYNRAASGMGYTGYPARIFFEMTNYGKGTQTYIEKLTILDKWYSHLRAYLPVMFEKKIADYNRDFAPSLIEVDKKLLDAWDEYKPTFEGVESFDPAEKDFTISMRNIFLHLDEITANAKVIDKEKYTDEIEAG